MSVREFFREVVENLRVSCIGEDVREAVVALGKGYSYKILPEDDRTVMAIGGGNVCIVPHEYVPMLGGEVIEKGSVDWSEYKRDVLQIKNKPRLV